MTSVVFRKLHTLRAQSARTILWLVPAWLLLGLFRILILAAPLRRLAPLFGQDGATDPWLPLVTPAQLVRAREIRRAIVIAVNYSPWGANCYPQALTARVLLRLQRVPHVLFFGLARSAETGEIDAHAWVMSGPVAVTGGACFGRFTVVRLFASAPALGPRAK